jgi:hypothetical protein
MDVSVLLEPTIDTERLAEVLDGLGHEGRVHTIRTWTRARQRAIFEAVKGKRPLDLEFLTPGVGSLVEVIHEGQNTLPAFQHFQKRFVKLEGEEFPVGGYNHQSTSAFTGPGYFVVTKGEGEHEGELAIDYRSLPKSKPASWPEIKGNTGGLGAIVYGGMVDYLRGVSKHVSIGRAYKGGKPMSAWFALVRKDPS